MTSLLLTLLLLAQTRLTETTEVLKTFYLTDNTSSQRLTEVVTALRQRIGLTHVSMSTAVNAITLRDTSARVAQAEKVIAEFGASRPGAPLTIDQAGAQDEVHIIKTFYLSATTTQRDLTETITALRTLLNARFLALNLNAKAIVIRDNWNQVALAAKVIADLDRSQPGEVGVPASAPIVVGPASAVAPPIGQGTERQILLANVRTEQGISELVITLRTLLNLRQVEGRTNAIILRDTENNLVLAEKIVADLDKVPSPVQ